MKTGLCQFSGFKIYPGHGSKFVRGDSKAFTFVNSKNERYFLMKRNPRKIRWTQVYRRLHKKGAVEEAAKKKTRRVQKLQRAIVGASLEVIKQKRNQKPEQRAASREAALKEIKERKKAQKAEKAKVKGAAPSKQAKAPATKKASAKGAKKASWQDQHAHLFPKDPKDVRIGRDIMHPGKDVSRFVKWPRYVRIQRQRAILKKRLKVPPAIAQFTQTLEKTQAGNLLKLLSSYRPESREEKKARRAAAAEAAAKSGEAKDDAKKPRFIKYGLNHVTHLVETKKAKLVVIAHDVDPIELVVWLPALCRKMDVPFVIIKGKSRLGHLVHKKSTSVIAVTDVKKEDSAKFEAVINSAKLQFSAPPKRWGGGVVGPKAQEVIRKREKAAARSLAAKSAK